MNATAAQTNAKPYFVLADSDTKGRLIGYRVCFVPHDDTANVEVEDGYFATAKSGWKVALHSANLLRDELNADHDQWPVQS